MYKWKSKHVVYSEITLLNMSKMYVFILSLQIFWIVLLIRIHLSKHHWDTCHLRTLSGTQMFWWKFTKYCQISYSYSHLLLLHPLCSVSEMTHAWIFSHWFSKYKNVFDKAYVTEYMPFQDCICQRETRLVSITKVRTQPETGVEQIGT